MRLSPQEFDQLIARHPNLFTLKNHPPIVIPKKRIRQSSRPLMNKLEAEFCERLKAYGWTNIYIQALRFRLANGLWYKPDFVVHDCLEPYCYEVKGPHAFRGGFENLKMAATTYRTFNWFLVWRENGVWQEQRILP